MTSSHRPDSKRQSPVLSLPVDQRLQKGLELLKSYIAEHGWENFCSTTRVDGFHVGQWVNMRRMAYRRGKLSEWLVLELKAVPGWSWGPREDDQRRKVMLLRQFVGEHGWADLTSTTVVDGVRLKSWVYGRRKAHAEGKLPAWLETELEAIPGWSFSLPHDTGLTCKGQDAMETLRRFVAECGWENFESATHVNGIQIGRFVTRWRTAHRRGELEPRIAEQLEAIPGWSWESTYHREQHLRHLALLREYFAEHGWKQMLRSVWYKGVDLHSWCESRRQDYHKEKLADWLRRELEAIPGWRWRLKDTDTTAADNAKA